MKNICELNNDQLAVINDFLNRANDKGFSTDYINALKADQLEVSNVNDIIIRGQCTELEATKSEFVFDQGRTLFDLINEYYKDLSQSGEYDHLDVEILLNAETKRLNALVPKHAIALETGNFKSCALNYLLLNELYEPIGFSLT